MILIFSRGKSLATLLKLYKYHKSWFEFDCWCVLRTEWFFHTHFIQMLSDVESDHIYLFVDGQMLSDVVICCQMMSYIVWCCLMLSDDVRCCHIMSCVVNVVRWCQMMQYVVWCCRCCQMLSHVVRWCHILSDDVICCQMLSDVVICCLMLSDVEGVRRKSFALLLLFPAHLYNLKEISCRQQICCLLAWIDAFFIMTIFIMTIVHFFSSFDGEFTSDSPSYITRTSNGKLLTQQNLISFMLEKKLLRLKNSCCCNDYTTPIILPDNRWHTYIGFPQRHLSHLWKGPASAGGEGGDWTSATSSQSQTSKRLSYLDFGN